MSRDDIVQAASGGPDFTPKDWLTPSRQEEKPNCGLPGCGLPFHHHVRPLAAPVPDAGLDVERLARAMEDHAWDIDCGGHCAPQIAREYAALSRQAEKETA